MGYREYGCSTSSKASFGRMEVQEHKCTICCRESLRQMSQSAGIHQNHVIVKCSDYITPASGPRFSEQFRGLSFRAQHQPKAAEMTSSFQITSSFSCGPLPARVYITCIMHVRGSSSSSPGFQHPTIRVPGKLKPGDRACAFATLCRLPELA